MSKIIVCDGCGKHSPDENGLHVANHWTHIKLRSGTDEIDSMFTRWEPNDSDLLYCTDCLPDAAYPADGQKLLPFLKRILKRKA